MDAAKPVDPAAVLRDARQRAGLTQTELAARAGTSQASVSDIERGHRQPTVELLDRLLRECNSGLIVAPGPEADLDPEDVMLLRLNMMLTPAERLAQVVRLARLRGLARR